MAIGLPNNLANLVSLDRIVRVARDRIPGPYTLEATVSEQAVISVVIGSNERTVAMTIDRDNTIILADTGQRMVFHTPTSHPGCEATFVGMLFDPQQQGDALELDFQDDDAASLDEFVTETKRGLPEFFQLKSTLKGPNWSSVRVEIPNGRWAELRQVGNTFALTNSNSDEVTEVDPHDLNMTRRLAGQLS